MEKRRSSCRVHRGHVPDARAGGVGHAGRMVCFAAKAIVESAIVDFWPGVDRALPHDGHRRVARLAARRLGRATTRTLALPRAART